MKMLVRMKINLKDIFEGSFFFLRIIAKIIFIAINFHAIILLLIAFFIAITVVIFYFYSNKKKLLLSYTVLRRYA